MLGKFMDLIGCQNSMKHNECGKQDNVGESLLELNSILDLNLKKRDIELKEKELQNECQICHESFSVCNHDHKKQIVEKSSLSNSKDVHEREMD